MSAKGDTKCIHIGEVDEKIKGNTKGCEECEKTGLLMGSPSPLFNMWTCWVLRLLC